MRFSLLLMVGRRPPEFTQAPAAFEAADVEVNDSGEGRMAVHFQPGRESRA